VSSSSEKTDLPIAYQSDAWQDHAVTRLDNGLIELTVVADGGHLADFRFLKSSGAASPNVLWESPWRHQAPSERRAEDLAKTAGLTGHALCLDRFGEPSPREAESGITLHGEAATKRWVATPSANPDEVACRWNVHLPIAHLEFERNVRLGSRESVVYIEETVRNQRSSNHECDWVQHATFGPPFLNEKESVFAASGARGLTAAAGYGDDSLLASDRPFTWPYAPFHSPQKGMTDLRRPLAIPGKGVIAAVLLDPKRQVEYILAVNRKWRLGVGYCFRSRDFPWMMVWEENCTRADRPWDGVTQARGMEFGTAPFPASREYGSRRGQLFETPTSCVISAGGAKFARYAMFLFRLPDQVTSAQSAEVHKDAIEIRGEGDEQAFSLRALGIERFLSMDDEG
jgi:hypothetical protein